MPSGLTRGIGGRERSYQPMRIQAAARAPPARSLNFLIYDTGSGRRFRCRVAAPGVVLQQF
jgi:hypothetical protein